MRAVPDRALSLRKVNKTYRSRGKPPVHAVVDVSFDMRPGEIVALLGSSGCGKTSTLRMVAGFEEVSEGAILLKGREVHRLPPARRNVAMAFEGYSLYPPLTVRENIGFALKSARLSREAIGARVAAMAKLLEIEAILDRYPSSLSGGQQQRASLGRALVREADLYLLDEPMGQLEPQLRSVLRGRLKAYLREHAMTSILVTHDQTEANALADRIAVMEAGVLQQFATPQELKERPANLFVGAFIGEPPMNVMNVRPARRDGQIVLALEGGDGLAFTFPEGEVPPPAAAALAGRERIVLGIRPHALKFGERGLPARLATNQWLGDQSHIASEAGPNTLISVTHRRMAARPGDPVTLDVSPRDLHLFDAATGVALAHGDRPA